LLNGENADLVRKLGTYAWEDSAEFRATLFWTDKFESFFKESRDYSPIKAVASYFGTTGVPPSTLANGYFYFSFSDEDGNDIGEKLRNDYRQVLQQMYETYHLDGLSKWSATWDMQGSVQPYATAPNLAPPWDMTSAAAHIDAPETESNYFDGVIDAVRAMGGGAMMGQKQIFSTELGAHRYFAYAVTWPIVLNDMKVSYAGGVNRIVSHGYPYSGYRPDAEWPGLTTFEWTYSEMWGPRQPSWQHANEFGDWIARTQLILQTGVPRVDIGIYRHKFISVDIKHYGVPENIFGDTSLADSGYSYVSVSPSNLLFDNAVVSDGILASNGPGFSAFIIDNSTNITSEATDRFLEYAKEGFPILFVGTVPEETPYYCPACDASVKARVQKLLEYPSVKSLTSESEVVSALEGLDIRPAAHNLQPTPIIYVHRWDEPNDVDYFWAYNSDIYIDHATEVSIKAHGTPYNLDAWTGQITPVLNYTAEGGRYKLWVELRSNQTTILAFAPKGFFPHVPVPDVHVVSTDVQYLNLSTSGTQIIARDTVNTDHQITLSNGHVHELKSSKSLPASTVLKPWNLTVQDWQPGSDPKQNYTSAFTYHQYTLDNLIPWYNISALENTSGIGIYTTQFNWDSSLAAGAYLDLGAVFMTIRLWVNNRWTGPIDVQDAVVDISEFLVQGVNDLKVEVSTTLRNRLIAVNVTQSWEQAKYSTTYGPQPYGLTGPVTLIPFLQTEISL
jgi:hypothetical protein